MVEFVVNIFVFFVGLSLLLPAKEKIGPLLYTSLAWFIGWLVLCLVQILCLFSGFQAQIENIGISLGVIMMAWWLFSYHYFKNRSGDDQIVAVRNRYSFCFCILSGILGILVIRLFTTEVLTTPDSHQYEAVGQLFHKIGVVQSSVQADAGIYKWVANIRTPFLPSIFNVAQSIGGDWIFTFPAISGFFLSMAMLGFLVERIVDTSIFAQILMILCLLCLFMHPLVRVHLLYIHSNWATACFFTLGTLLILKFSEEREFLWFWIGVVLLGFCAIIRKEMLVFSLIPLFCFFTRNKVSMRLRLSGLVLFIIISTSWYLWTAIELAGFTGYAGIDNVFSSHGDALTGFVAVPLGFIVFAIPWYRLTLERILPLTVCAVTLVLYLVNAEFAGVCDNLSQLMFERRGFWLHLWDFIVAGLVGYAFLSILKYLLDRVHGVSNISASSEELTYLFQTILLFFVARIVLYFIAEGPQDTVWLHSGNRILLHILPLCTYFMARMLDVNSHLVSIKDKVGN